MGEMSHLDSMVLMALQKGSYLAAFNMVDRFSEDPLSQLQAVARRHNIVLPEWLTAKAKFDGDFIEVNIGGRGDFREQLALLKTIPNEDRDYDPKTFIWTIRNPFAYRHIACIKEILDDLEDFHG